MKTTLTKKQVQANLKKLSKPLTEEDRKVTREGFIKGMADLGAEYLSHGEHNIYFKLKEGHQFNDVRKKRAKETAFVMTGLLLRFTE